MWREKVPGASALRRRRGDEEKTHLSDMVHTAIRHIAFSLEKLLSEWRKYFRMANLRPPFASKLRQLGQTRRIGVVNAFAAAPPHRATALSPVRETLATRPHALRCVLTRIARSARAEVSPALPLIARPHFGTLSFPRLPENSRTRDARGIEGARVARGSEPAAESSLRLST